MKKQITLFLLMFSMFVACSNNDNDDPEENDDKKEVIELKGYPGSSNKMSFKVIAKDIVIDWGDGTIEEYNPEGGLREFYHEYSSQDLQTISVKGKNVSSLFALGNQLNGKLTHLDIKNADSLTLIECGGNLLTSLDLGGCVNLKSLQCTNNKLISLDVKKCIALTSLACTFNQLSSLEVNTLTNLIGLSCSYNELTVLDVKSCEALANLSCEGNQLSSLDVRGLANLEYLYCLENVLSYLYISDCKSLIYLDFRFNPLGVDAICSIYEDLSERELRDGVVRAPLDEYGTCTVIALSKGWNL